MINNFYEGNFMKIKRYDFEVDCVHETHDIKEDPGGEYIKYEDIKNMVNETICYLEGEANKIKTLRGEKVNRYNKFVLGKKSGLEEAEGKIKNIFKCFCI